jgi:integrative and conjugative element protein (TIGR02256 family)
MLTKIDDDKAITLIGCGSLGSKVGVHLARNGNGPFLCVDDDIFMPHNNARHALTLTWAQNKAELLSLSIFSIGKILSTSAKEDALNVDYSKSRMIIDTTASFSVRNFLMNRADLPPVISCGLYDKGRAGLMLTENGNKTSSLAKIWAHLYHQSLTDEDVHRILFSSNLKNVSIGQSCSSRTMVVDDAQISLMAATMSLKIQHILEAGLPKNAEILLAQYDDNYCLRSTVYTVPDFIQVKSTQDKEWMIFISEPIIERMRNIMHHKSPKETGGALLGSVFLYPKTVVITDIIDAPPDSVQTPTLFMLGVEGLERKVKDTEKRTNGKVTYLGTWHSHPCGGKASQTDKRAFNKLLFVRNYEPTVCLIITEKEVMMV